MQYVSIWPRTPRTVAASKRSAIVLLVPSSALSVVGLNRQLIVSSAGLHVSINDSSIRQLYDHSMSVMSKGVIGCERYHALAAAQATRSSNHNVAFVPRYALV